MKKARIEKLRNGVYMAVDIEDNRTIVWAFYPYWVRETAIMQGYELID